MLVCLGACVNVLRDVKRGFKTWGEVLRLVETFWDLWRGFAKSGRKFMNAFLLENELSIWWKQATPGSIHSHSQSQLSKHFPNELKRGYFVDWIMINLNCLLVLQSWSLSSARLRNHGHCCRPTAAEIALTSAHSWHPPVPPQPRPQLQHDGDL